MGLLLGLIIPTLTIFTPLTILILIGRRKNRIDRTDFGVAILGCFLVGLIVPIVATFLSARGLAYNFGPDDSKCVTGAAVFIFFGYLINLIGVPICWDSFISTKAIDKEIGVRPKRTANKSLLQAGGTVRH